MRYFVLADDGSAYGPADVPTLASWVAESRIQPTTMLRDEATGQVVPASSIPGLFPTSPAGIPVMTPPVSAPMGGYQGYTPGGSGVAYSRGYANDGTLPASVASKFNWGAFLLSWIWGLNHKKPILLLLLVIGCIPYLGVLIDLGLRIYVGFNGNKWAWESGRFRSVQDMEDCQAIWLKWGVGILILGFALGFLGAILFPILAGVNRGLR